MSFQPVQAVGQNVRGDAFFGLQELLVGSESTQQHVADDQQGPTIAQHLDRGVQWAGRPPLCNDPTSRHAFETSAFHLHFTSDMNKLTFAVASILTSGDVYARE
jgi:hypothetical protein